MWATGADWKPRLLEKPPSERLANASRQVSNSNGILCFVFVVCFCVVPILLGTLTLTGIYNCALCTVKLCNDTQFALVWRLAVTCFYDKCYDEAMKQELLESWYPVSRNSMGYRGQQSEASIDQLRAFAAKSANVFGSLHHHSQTAPHRRTVLWRIIT